MTLLPDMYTGHLPFPRKCPEWSPLWSDRGNSPKQGTLGHDRKDGWQREEKNRVSSLSWSCGEARNTSAQAVLPPKYGQWACPSLAPRSEACESKSSRQTFTALGATPQNSFLTHLGLEKREGREPQWATQRRWKSPVEPTTGMR